MRIKHFDARSHRTRHAFAQVRLFRLHGDSFGHEPVSPMGKGFHQSGRTVRKGVVQFPPRYPRSRRRILERFVRKAGLPNLIQRFSENAIAHEVGHSAARLDSLRSSQ